MISVLSNSGWWGHMSWHKATDSSEESQMTVKGELAPALSCGKMILLPAAKWPDSHLLLLFFHPSSPVPVSQRLASLPSSSGSTLMSKLSTVRTGLWSPPVSTTDLRPQFPTLNCWCSSLPDPTFKKGTEHLDAGTPGPWSL